MRQVLLTTVLCLSTAMGILAQQVATPTGQKLLHEMPAIMAESMQSVMPLMQKHVEAMKERVQQEAAQMIKDSKGANEKSPATPN
jgi:hypothetical protein